MRAVRLLEHAVSDRNRRKRLRVIVRDWDTARRRHRQAVLPTRCARLHGDVTKASALCIVAAYEGVVLKRPIRKRIRLEPVATCGSFED